MKNTFDMPHFVTVPIFENHKNKFLALNVVSKLFRAEITVFVSSGGRPPERFVCSGDGGEID